MLDIDRDIREFRAEANRDFIGLWHIASDIEDELDSARQRDVRYNTLKVVEGLMEFGVLPGDYSHGESSFRFWPGSPEEQLDRIETEWIEMGMTPTLADPICWFSLRPAGIVGEPVWIEGEWKALQSV